MANSAYNSIWLICLFIFFFLLEVVFDWLWWFFSSGEVVPSGGSYRGSCFSSQSCSDWRTGNLFFTLRFSIFVSMAANKTLGTSKSSAKGLHIWYIYIFIYLSVFVCIHVCGHWIYGFHGWVESNSVLVFNLCSWDLICYFLFCNCVVEQAILKIIKHCKEFSPALVTGQLLGLDVGSVLEVTNCFPFPVCYFSGQSSNYVSNCPFFLYHVLQILMCLIKLIFIH